MNKTPAFFLRIFCSVLFFSFSTTQVHSSRPDKVTYLGVHATKLSPEMSHQLDFPPGLYLNVVRVGENSPAQKAGLMVYDVLLAFDDQILINQEQLKQLVRTKRPGEVIDLKLVRKGSEKKIEVILEETDRRAEREFGNRMDPFGDDFFSGNDFFGNDRLRKFFGREFGFDSLRKQMFPNEPSFPGGFDSIDSSNPDDPVHQPGADIQSFSYSSSQNQVVVTDEEGTLEWTEKDGSQYLRVTTLDGQIIFEGPINSEEERKLLPAGVNDRLEKIENKNL